MEQHGAPRGRPAGGGPRPGVRAFAEVSPGLASVAPQAAWVSIHLHPPAARADVMSGLDDAEPRLLSRVCCACCTLDDAARELGLTHAEALRMWRAVAHRLG